MFKTIFLKALTVTSLFAGNSFADVKWVKFSEENSYKDQGYSRVIAGSEIGTQFANWGLKVNVCRIITKDGGYILGKSHETTSNCAGVNLDNNQIIRYDDKHGRNDEVLMQTSLDDTVWKTIRDIKDPLSGYDLFNGGAESELQPVARGNVFEAIYKKKLGINFPTGQTRPVGVSTGQGTFSLLEDSLWESKAWVEFNNAKQELISRAAALGPIAALTDKDSNVEFLAIKKTVEKQSASNDNNAE